MNCKGRYRMWENFLTLLQMTFLKVSFEMCIRLSESSYGFAIILVLILKLMLIKLILIPSDY